MNANVLAKAHHKYNADWHNYIIRQLDYNLYIETQTSATCALLYPKEISAQEQFEPKYCEIQLSDTRRKPGKYNMYSRQNQLVGSYCFQYRYNFAIFAIQKSLNEFYIYDLQSFYFVTLFESSNMLEKCK
ncbi:Hypothetical_protein [Hexamita inflata]|uniref:Hypothetical_protein n=1 Tax=Hexamita inflata TaxID=28002 RepID=A0ABP1GS92_9EUKA